METMLTDGASARPNGVTTSIALKNKFAKTFLPLDLRDVGVACQGFCYIIKKAAEKVIPHSYRNKYTLCRDAECESLYPRFLQSPQGNDSSLDATALPAKRDRKWRNRWSEAVFSIKY